MPDFGTRSPQRQNVSLKLRVTSVAKKLGALVMTNRLRSLLIGSGLLLFVAVALVGLPLYSSAVANCSSTSMGGVEKGSEKIAFVLHSDIYTMNINGSDRKQVTATSDFEGNAIEEHDPAWSPDHKKIAFSRTRTEHSGSSASSEAVTAIYVMNADGSGERKLLDWNTASPTWSPDGKNIAFATDNGIHVMNANGSGEPERLTPATEGISYTDLAWSPDGEKIAFVSNRRDGRRLNNYTDIYVAKACSAEGATNRLQRLTDKHGWNRDPAWSPDGNRIAFTYLDFGSAHLYGNSAIRNTDIYTVGADGRDEIRLTHTNSGKHAEYAPAWSPEGGRVAFIKGYLTGTHAEPTSTIYLIKPDGSDLSPVTTFPEAYDMEMAWR
jgi:Tol biopolymer transport system component